MGYKHPQSKLEVAPTKPPKPPKPTKCACCGAKTSTKCSACEDSPEYHTGDARDVYYCSKKCQTKHWPTHKDQCNALQKRKKLLRCAELLKEAFLAYREIFFNLHLTSITFRDRTLFLNQKPYSQTDRYERFDFPDHLTPNPEHKEAALMDNQSIAASILLGPLVNKLLKGVCSQVQVAEFTMKTDAESRPFRTQLIPGSTEERPHTVFVARVPRGKGEEKWVIDTTGSQYGFREVLVPYKKYSKEKASALANPLTASNAGINKDLDEYVRDPRLCWHEQQVANLLADRHTRQHFATFIANCADDDFLFGPDDHMKAMCEVFVADLKYYLRKARD